MYSYPAATCKGGIGFFPSPTNYEVLSLFNKSDDILTRYIYQTIYQPNQ